jgi:hypothetical protein
MDDLDDSRLFSLAGTCHLNDVKKRKKGVACSGRATGDLGSSQDQALHLPEPCTLFHKELNSGYLLYQSNSLSDLFLRFIGGMLDIIVDIGKCHINRSKVKRVENCFLEFIGMK